MCVTIDAWWPKLRPETREWLIANNGDVVPSSIVEEITEAGGPAQTDDWWVIDHASDGACMPDEAVDWIEEIANEETPLPSGNRVRACPETSGAEPSIPSAHSPGTVLRQSLGNRRTAWPAR